MTNISLKCMVAVLGVGLAQLACAHAYPTRQSPDAGAILSDAPSQVVIDYDDALEPAFSSLTVTDGAGKSVASGKSAVDPDDSKRMAVRLAPLAPGVYAVAWVAVAHDGHRTQGHYGFSLK
jgi:methionine-rich copper-binding protein CopC